MTGWKAERHHHLPLPAWRYPPTLLASWPAQAYYLGDYSLRNLGNGNVWFLAAQGTWRTIDPDIRRVPHSKQQSLVRSSAGNNRGQRERRDRKEQEGHRISGNLYLSPLPFIETMEAWFDSHSVVIRMTLRTRFWTVLVLDLASITLSV